MRKTGKRLLSLLLAVVLLLSCVPNVVLGEDVPIYEIGPYYEVDKNGQKKEDTETKNPVKEVDDEKTDAYVKFSKTIPEDDVEDDEFVVTLNVETTQDLSEIPQGASVVLVFDVSDAMDWTTDGLIPSNPDWKLENTRWTALKTAAEVFIESFLADNESDNQISIVVYGGNGYTAYGVKQNNFTVYKTICEWTNAGDTDAIETVKKTFNEYDTVSEDTIIDGNLTNASSLRKAVFNDLALRYGGSVNSQAGFKGATEQLGNYDHSNTPYVVFMSVGDADDSIDIPAGALRDKEQAYKDAKAEAGKLMDEHPDCLLYTVGFGKDAQDSRILNEGTDNNPYVDKYFPADDADELAKLYSSINDRISSLSQAWKVTDPMSDYVQFNGASSGDSYTVDADGTITWDLLNATAVEEPSGVYTYTLKYTIKLKDNTDWVESTLTNKDTTLTYLFSDEYGKVEPPEEMPTAHFLVPTVKGLPNGSIDKTASKTEVQRGETFEYTIKASNDKGTASWKDVIATDILDSDLTYVGSEVVNGSDVTVDENDGTVEINFGQIGQDDYKEVLIKVSVNKDAKIGKIDNTVTAISSNDDDKTDDESVDVIGPDGSITKKAGTTEVQPGRSYTYTITASNSEDATEPWKNVVATDTLDSVLSLAGYTSTDGVTVNETSGVLEIEFGDIEQGKSKSVDITVNVSSTAAVGTRIPNAVLAQGGNDGINVDPEKGEDPVKPEVVGPVGSIEKTASAAKVERGEVYYYTITATNSGKATWENVVGTDLLDSDYIIFDSFLSTQGVTVTNESGTLKIDFEDIKPDESKTVLIYVKVNKDAVIGDNIKNSVTVKGNNDIPVNPNDPDDPANIINGEDPIRPEVIGPDGSINKSASVTEIRADGTFDYTITAENIAEASGAWKDVIATDTLDDRLIITDYPKDMVSVNGQDVTINFGNIGIGEKKSVTITVKVDPNADVDNIYNTVTATSSNFQDVNDDETVNIIGPVGTIEKTSSVTDTQPGDSFEYTITASNAVKATEAWANVVATDELDKGLTFDSVVSSSQGVTVDNKNGTLTINFGDIAAGDSKTVTIKVTVKPGTFGEINNSVIAKSENYRDVTDDAVVNSTGPGGSITKSASVAEVTHGERYYYTITATNNGNETWENVVGTDILDGNFISFDSYIPQQDVSVNNNNGTLTINFGDIPAGDSKTVRIYVRVNDNAAIGGKILNAVTVEGTNDPPNVPVDPGIDPVKPVVISPVGSITKTASSPQVRVGNSFSYTITATNSDEANQTWKNVIATDKLDGALTYVGHDPLPSGVTVSQYNGEVTIDFGDIEPGDTKSVIINVSVKSNTEDGNIYNAVKAKSNNYRDVEDHADVTIIGPLGKIEKTSSVDEVQPGGSFEYTIKASNDAAATDKWENVEATDVLDDNLSFDSVVSSSQGVTVTNNNGTLKIDFGDIAQDTSKEVTIKVTVSATVKPGTVIKNSVTAKGRNDLTDPPKEDDPNPPVVTYPVGSITKTASVPDVGPGERYYYTITASNKGNTTWENVVGTDTLNSNYIAFDSYISSHGVSVSNNNGDLTINFGDIPAGESKTVLVFVRVNVNAKVGDRIPNAVIASGNNDFPDDPGNPIKGEDPVEPVINSFAGSITKVASVNEARVGDSFSYTITASAKGNETWKNVIATDILDKGLTYVNCDIPAGSGITVSENNGILTISFGDIEPGKDKSVTINVTVKSNSDDKLYNTVTAKSDNYRDVDDTVSVNIVGPLGQLEKTSNVTEVKPGDSFEYTIKASNRAGATAVWEGVEATDVLDENLSFDSVVSSSQGVTVDNKDGTLTINFGDIDAGQTKEITIKVTVSDAVEPGTVIKNSVTAKGSNDLPDPPPTKDDDPDPPVVTYPVGSITKTASVSDVSPGERYYYTITASNKGNETWENVVGTDTLNSNYITFDSYISSHGASVSNDNGTLTINFGDIPAGESRTVFIFVRVNANAKLGDRIPNAVIASGGNDVDPDNPPTGDDPLQPIITSLKGSISKDASVEEVRVGESFSYTITATNEGNETWENVIGTDELDSALNYVNYEGQGITVTETGGFVTINFGNIGAGQKKTVTINVTVNSGTDNGWILNTVKAKSDNYRDVEAYDTVKIIGPKGTIEKRSGVDAVQPGGGFEYTIKASNGPDATEAWKNVIATDNLDTDLSYDSFTGDPGVTVTNNNGTLTIDFGDIDPGQTKEVKISVTVSQNAAVGKTINNTVIAEGENDPPGPPPTDEDPDPPVVVNPGGSITKKASVAEVGRSEIYYYSVTAYNSGNVTWENVVGTDDLRGKAVTFDSYLSMQDVFVSNNNGVLTIEFGDIPAGGSRTVLIYVRVNDNAVIGDRIQNAVTAKGDNDPDPVDPDKPIIGEDPVQPQVVGPDGTISKDASVSVVRAGEEYYYTITASNSNNANVAWKNVIATDQLDGALTYAGNEVITGTGITVTEYGGLVTINFGDIGLGEEKTVRIKVTVKSNANDGDVYNTVTAKSNNYPDVNDNATVNVVSPSGTLTKTSSVNEVQPGGSFDYTITASNSASATATWEDVVATDVLDSDLSYVSFEGSQGVTVTNNNGTLTINFGNIAAGASKYVKISVRVSENVAIGKTVNNSVTAVGKYDPPNPPPIVDPDPPEVVEPVGSITKSASVNTVQTGQSFYYTISVTNTGTTAWNNVIATDVLNSDLTYDRYEITQGSNITVSQSGGTVTINFGDIPIGGTKTVRIHVGVNANAAAGTLNNTVNAASDNYDPVSASYPITVVGADGTITKRANSSTVIQGETYTYTITAINNSTGTWQNVVATDILDTSLITYVGSSSSQGVSVNNNNGTLTINFGDVESGATKAITISVTVNWGVAAGTRIPNTVTYGSKTAEDPVRPEVLGPEITATKTSNRDDTTAAADQVIYEITVENTGDAPAYDVVVNDNIAEGVDFVSGSVQVNGATTSAYNYTNGVLSVSIGDLAVGESATVIFWVDVTLDAVGESIENTGEATGYSNKNHGPSDTPDLSDEFSDNNTTPVVSVRLTDDHIAYIIGYDGKTVRPENNISRAETATIVFRLLEDYSRTLNWSKTNNYSDVESDKWYNNAISTMTKAGVLEGYPDGSFGPNDDITRAEFAAIMARFDSTSYTGPDKFTDLGEAEWAREYINRAAEKGWVEGYGDGTFRPNDKIKRDEAMTFINRVLDRANIKEMHEDMVTWDDNDDETKWYYKAVQEATNSHYFVRNDDGSETWTEWRERPDWEALEREWATANG